MQASNSVNGKILWTNLHLLFWLSLFPFATGYMGENHFQELPTALYGFVLFMASLAWYILLKALSKKLFYVKPIINSIRQYYQYFYMVLQSP